MTTPLELMRELVRDDDDYAATLAELDELLRKTVAVRELSDRLAALLAAGPAERERIAGELSAARAEAHERAETLAHADTELAAAEIDKDEERLAAARRFHTRAKDAAAVADKRAVALDEEGRVLEQRLEQARAESSQLEARAAELAAALAGRSRLAAEAGRPPGRGLDGVVDWASVARAALLVARNGVATERDAVIRQANELGSALVGEPLAATSAAVVARRVERQGAARRRAADGP